MRVKGIFGKAATGILVASMAFSMAKADTLADAMAGAYSHSGLLDQNRALLRAADEGVAQANAALRPILNYAATAAHSYNSTTNVTSNTATITLSLSQLLHDWGASQAGIEAQKQTVLATRQQLISIEQNVLLAAVDAYMNLRRDTEIVALRENNLRVITRELRAANDRFEVGEITRTDVATAEARLAGARAELAAARGTLMMSQEIYAAVVGKRPGTLAAPGAFPATATSASAASSLAVRSHPDMLAAQYQVAAAEAGIAQARAAMRPSTSLSANLGFTDDLRGTTTTNTRSLSVTASGPIYQGGLISSRLRQAMAQRDAARGGLHATRHNIRQGVGIAWAQVLSARAQTAASQEQIKAAEVAFEGVREEASLGSRTTLDVLNAEQELLNAKANAVSAQSAEYTATYSLLASMGLLTVDHLNLRVQRYDPEAYYNLVKSAPVSRSKQGAQLDKVLKALGKE